MRCQGPARLNRFFKSLPNRNELTNHPWIAPVAGRLLEPKLWRLQHESVARGVAIGVFWAFVIPFAQIVVAALHCIWWRAHIPVAAAVTMLTNPLTIGFWLWLAYHVGSFVVGGSATTAPVLEAGVSDWLTKFGWPTLVGMGFFAVGGAISGYLLVKLVWRLSIFLKVYRRRQKRAAV